MNKNPKLKQSSFCFIYNKVEYDVTFYPQKDKKYFTVEIENMSTNELLKCNSENTHVNKTCALFLLSNTLKLNLKKKSSGLKKDTVSEFKEINSICPNAVEKYHVGLQNDINHILNRYSQKWVKLKNLNPNYVYLNKDSLDIDGDEFTAIICAGIYKNAPFADRIEFLSSFLNRTTEQIKTLLYYHFIRYNSFTKDDFYQEIFVEFETHISLYFTKFYKIDYVYGH